MGQTPSGGNSNRRPLLFIGLGVLAVVLILVAVVAAGGGDDTTSASPSAESTGDASSPESDVRQEDLGSFAQGEAIPVTVEADDLSFLLTAVAEDPEEPLTVRQVTDPSGNLIYDLQEDGAVEGELTATSRGGVGPGEVGLMVPAQPGLDIEPGTYEVLIDNEANVEATATIKSGDASPEITQAIDLNVWLLSADYDHATLEAGLTSGMNAVLGPQNLEVGTISFTDGDADAIASFNGPDPDAPLYDTCRAMSDAVGSSRALNLVVVETFDPAENSGLSSGLPGSPLVPDVGGNCVVVATQLLDQLVELPALASTVVHEGSHFMGLTHTSESDSSVFDDFADTPDCLVSEVDGVDAFGYVGEVDQMISATECGVEGGAANYMFFEDSPLDARDVLTQQEMTADQAWALRRHPLFYPVAGGSGSALDELPAPDEVPEADPGDDSSLDDGSGALPATSIADYGSDPAMDALADACEAGDLASCETLFLESAVSSGYEEYGFTCGGRDESGELCTGASGGG